MGISEPHKKYIIILSQLNTQINIGINKIGSQIIHYTIVFCVYLLLASYKKLFIFT